MIKRVTGVHSLLLYKYHPSQVFFLHFRPPYWIRYFEFLNSELGFVLSLV